jgi:hypothetical protein
LKAKFLVFVVISNLLVAKMYSLPVFAKTTVSKLETKYSTTTCIGDKQISYCEVINKDDGSTIDFTCEKQKNGTWKCTQNPDQTVGNISAGLKQALISAQGGMKTGSSNTTILQGNGNSEGGNSEGGNSEGGNSEGGNSEGGNSEGGNSKMPLRLNATTSTNPDAVMGSNSTFQ